MSNIGLPLKVVSYRNPRVQVGLRAYKISKGPWLLREPRSRYDRRNSATGSRGRGGKIKPHPFNKDLR